MGEVNSELLFNFGKDVEKSYKYKNNYIDVVHMKKHIVCGVKHPQHDSKQM